jgi:hypothetical protein
MAENKTPTPDEIPNLAIDPIAEKLPTVVDWLPETIVPYWEVVAQFPIVGALIIVGASFLVALLVRMAIFHSLERLAGMTTSLVDDHILRDLRKPVFATVLYSGLILAVAATQLPIGTSVLVNLAVSIIVASWMRAALHISNSVLRALEKQRLFTLIEPRTVPLFDLTIKLGTVLIGSYVLLLVWGVNPVGWLASAGIVGIAWIGRISPGFARRESIGSVGLACSGSRGSGAGKDRRAVIRLVNSLVSAKATQRG